MMIRLQTVSDRFGHVLADDDDADEDLKKDIDFVKYSNGGR